MHPTTWICIIALLASPLAASADEGKQVSLLGQWDVSLYYSPDQPPSKTEMVVTAMAHGKLEGSFYGSPFTQSGYTIHQGRLLFTVVTSDSTGPYLHSGRRVGLCLEGQTLSTGRDFLMAWTACPSAPQDAE